MKEGQSKKMTTKARQTADNNTSMQYNNHTTENEFPDSNTATPPRGRKSLPVQMRDTLQLYAAHWKWFAAALTVALGCAVWYLATTPKTYTCSTSILVKQDDQNPNEQQMQDFGITPSSPNLVNERLQIKSTPMAEEVVRRLDLETSCYRIGKLRDEVVYGTSLAVKVSVGGLSDAETSSFMLNVDEKGNCVIRNMQRGGRSYSGEARIRLGETAKLPVGETTVTASGFMPRGRYTYRVERASIKATAAHVRSSITPSLRDPKSSIIDITYRDANIERAIDVLKTLVAVYNESWVNDRNCMTQSTNEFIKGRISVIEDELRNFDRNISSYKSHNLMPDVKTAGAQAMSQSAETSSEARQLANQLYTVRYIRANILDGNHANQLLPGSSGLGNPSIMQQITEYNELLLKRNKHLATSSEQSPVVKELDANLKVRRQAIIGTLDNEIAMLSAQQASLHDTKSQVNARIAANPKQEEYLLSLERQQKVKEALYIFLLQKHEDNEMSQAFTAYNTKTIEPAHVGGGPTTPVDRHILSLALLAALLVPAGIISLCEALNTAVRSRKDFEKLNIPFAGEIPLEGKPAKRLFTLQPRTKSNAHRVVVESENRNSINEAFRVVRSNLEFLLGASEGGKVIMLTSMYPGSGKTFVSHNLAMAMGINGKRTIVVDLDMRRGSLSAYAGSPQCGVSNWLGSQIDDYHSAIVNSGAIDIMPCGTIPPNPTELLGRPKFASLINGLRGEYEYIFIDCPPCEIVADAGIINPHADATLFVVRANSFDRSLLPTLEQWYENGKFKNLSVLLNATTESSRNRYYGEYYGTHRNKGIKQYLFGKKQHHRG